METIQRKVTNLFLDMSKPMNRIIRRGIVVGILTGVSVMLVGYQEIAPALYLPVISGILAMIDKGLREHKA